MKRARSTPVFAWLFLFGAGCLGATCWLAITSVGALVHSIGTRDAPAAHSETRNDGARLTAAAGGSRTAAPGRRSADVSPAPFVPEGVEVGQLEPAPNPFANVDGGTPRDDLADLLLVVSGRALWDRNMSDDEE